MLKYFCYRALVKTKSLLFFLIFLIIPTTIATIIIRGINYYNGFYYDNNKILELITRESVLVYLFITYLVFFIMLLLLNKLISKNKIFNNENWFDSLGKALVPSIMAFGLALVMMSFISSLIGMLPDILNIKKNLILPNKALAELLNNINEETNYKIIIWLFFIIVIAPIYEEILFRGFLQAFISKFFKFKNFDIILIALLFSLFHLPSFLNIVYAFIIGIFLSIQRKKNKSINVTIWMHCLINFAGVVLAITYQYLLNK